MLWFWYLKFRKFVVENVNPGVTLYGILLDVSVSLTRDSTNCHLMSIRLQWWQIGLKMLDKTTFSGSPEWPLYTSLTTSIGYYCMLLWNTFQNKIMLCSNYLGGFTIKMLTSRWKDRVSDCRSGQAKVIVNLYSLLLC